MRPRGELRLTIGGALPPLGSGAATWRDVALQTGIGFAAARRTVENMAAAGDALCVGRARVPGVSRPMNLYAAAPASRAAAPALESVVRGWASFV